MKSRVSPHLGISQLGASSKLGSPQKAPKLWLPNLRSGSSTEHGALRLQKHLADARRIRGSSQVLTCARRSYGLYDRRSSVVPFGGSLTGCCEAFVSPAATEAPISIAGKPSSNSTDEENGPNERTRWTLNGRTSHWTRRSLRPGASKARTLRVKEGIPTNKLRG